VPGQGYVYRFVNVAAGNYYVVAMVDVTNDGVSDFYRCFPQADGGGCISGQTLAIGSTGRTDNFQIYADSSFGVGAYGIDSDTSP
jgi:hypothetical protein